jgi:hypothetical protein
MIKRACAEETKRILKSSVIEMKINYETKDFTKPVPQALLNIEEKNRTNLFAWRGQFSPQLIECLLAAYCPPNGVVIDPFAGSGTVLLESASMRLSAYGFEVNPSAWIFSKVYELTILEEFLPQLLFRSLNLKNGSLEFGPCSTFAGLSFVSSLANTGTGGGPVLRTKDQDFVLGKRLYMMTSFNKDFHDAERVEAHLGYVCAECKTNLDKTMFQEAVATSRDLKIAVPSSLYFLVCEYLDMTPVSITSTNIDDVLIVRKAKRLSSNVRQEYRSAKERQENREAYAQFVESSKYYADVFQRMINKVQQIVNDTNPEMNTVLKRGYF